LDIFRVLGGRQNLIYSMGSAKNAKNAKQAVNVPEDVFALFASLVDYRF